MVKRVDRLWTTPALNMYLWINTKLWPVYHQIYPQKGERQSALHGNYLLCGFVDAALPCVWVTNHRTDEFGLCSSSCGWWFGVFVYRCQKPADLARLRDPVPQIHIWQSKVCESCFSAERVAGWRICTTPCARIRRTWAFWSGDLKSVAYHTEFFANFSTQQLL